MTHNRKQKIASQILNVAAGQICPNQNPYAYESILLNWSRIARNQKSTVLLKFAEVGEVAEHDQSPRGQGILKLQAW